MRGLPHATVFVLFALLAAGLSLAGAGCAQEEHPYPAPEARSSDGGDAGDAPDAFVGPRYCTQAQAESLPARLVAMSAQAAPAPQVILVSQVFDAFSTACNKCHGPLNSMGGFQIATVADFTLAYIKAQNVLDHVQSNVGCPFTPDPTKTDDPMPPCTEPNSMPYAQRGPDDEVRQFGDLLAEWIDAGGPPSFTPPSSSSSSVDAGADAATPSAFVMTPSTGNTMTNLGNCVPSPALVNSEQTRSLALDAKFAAATAQPRSQPGGTPYQYIGLPANLSDTDLFTFDSATLAQYGVVAYAPGYPLWSDNAGKIRYVRVPRGQSIHFDKATQQFVIPPNTRFYKTFMKQIVDTDGSYRYRKIETRLIVARPDQNNADGTVTQTALYGTYLWNDDESEATLYVDLLNDGTPFPDKLLTYDTDEPLAAAVLAGNPLDTEEALTQYGAIRHYAVPSSQRCVQCHMGSASQTFVLGFMPLEINRRPVGSGGTIEATGPHELDQLQRLIDYGVVTGVDSPADILPLEQSQGTRSPRSDAELTAQGYMLGNCAHCHNARGYPTSIQPLLKDLLDFLPSAAGGGIFQFPLERQSPDIFRGRTGTTPIAFITPSLMDLPRVDLTTGKPVADPFFGGEVATSDDAGDTLETLDYAAYAPWRSLVYRNVQTAFTYLDDQALYPHMPLNTPGYDPRVQQIMGAWMVGIPAIRKDPATLEYSFYGTSGKEVGGVNPPDSNVQPYAEVLPGDPRYADALAAANERVQIFEGTASNAALPPPAHPYLPYTDPAITSDIVDPEVLLDPTCHPSPNQGAQAGTQGGQLPYIEHPQWVELDLSQRSGSYAPRRADWANVLVSGTPPLAPQSCNAGADVASAYADQLDVIGLDQTASFERTDTVGGTPESLRTWATTALPMGLWQPKTGCDYASQPTVGQLAGKTGTHWMTSTAAGAQAPASTAPVYTETPGAEVFKMVCINCHGKRADSNGFIAQNLTLLTGGVAVPADFRDGLFGPTTSPGSNAHLAFGPASLPASAPASWTGVTDDDRAARYMAWMALGGTQVVIPGEILTVVQETPVFGVPRLLPVTSANMLSTARGLCVSLLGPDGQQQPFTPETGYLDQPALSASLIHTNGDAELWLRMCSFANPAPVHMITYVPGASDLQSVSTAGILTLPNPTPEQLIRPASYVANGGTTVGDENGRAVSVSASADGGTPQGWPLWPWCLIVSPGDTAPPGAPLCPAGVQQLAATCVVNHQNGVATGASDDPDCWDSPRASKWAVQGAMNAGFSVYLYIQSLEALAAPPPDYNQCPQ